MFTGIIIELAVVSSIDFKGQNARLSLKSKDVIRDAKIGDSISVNGVCLTVTNINTQNNELSFDISFETLKNTNLGELKIGDKVNLEPSLTPSSKIGGHFVTGHIEGVGRVIDKREIGNALKIEIQSPRNVLDYLVEKGSIAVDGISLTVVDVNKDSFSVVIIPHTAKMTTIGIKDIGDSVNLEPDILGKYVAKFLNMTNNKKDERLLSLLQRSGFIG
jgi:riboflavin synthase